MGCGGGKGGCGGGGGCGAAVGIVAAIVLPVAGAYLGTMAAGAMGATAGSFGAMAGGALGGAVGGGLGSVVNGGKFGTGALTGAIGGGIMGYGGAFGAIESGAGWAGNAGNAVSAVDTAATVAPAIGTEAASAQVAGAVSDGTMAAFGPTESALGSGMAGLDTGAANLTNWSTAGGTGGLSAGLDAGANASFVNAGLDTVNLANSSQMMSGAANPAMAGTTAGTPAAGAGTGAGTTKEGGFFDGAKEYAKKVVSPDNLMKAGIQLGAQSLAGSMAETPDMGAMNSYLNDVKGMQMQANQFNMDMANKKAGIGDKMVQSAENYNPEYYALQAQNQQKGRRAQQWADTESQMRAQGYDQNYINAMKNKFDLDTSTAAGTAYDSGWQTGQQARNSTYAQAGGMYGQVQAPSAGLSSSYMDLYKAGQQDASNLAKTFTEVAGVQSEDTRKKPTDTQ